MDWKTSLLYIYFNFITFYSFFKKKIKKVLSTLLLNLFPTEKGPLNLEGKSKISEKVNKNIIKK